MSPAPFVERLTGLLDGLDLPKGLVSKIAEELGVPDRTAEIQRDKKGEIIYDEELKDTEIVPFKEDIESYMAREVWPHIPHAKYVFEEKLTGKKPVIKTGAEYPFTRQFYTYEPPREPEEVLTEILKLDAEIDADFAQLKEEC